MTFKQKGFNVLLMCCLLVVSLAVVQPLQAEDMTPSTVQLTIDTSAVEGGRILLEEALPVTDQSTAYSVLEDALGENLEVEETSYGPYVKQVLGLSEFAAGPSSGWLFDVNGLTPDRGAGAYVVHPGDHVRWYYTTFELMPVSPENPEKVQGALEDLETYILEQSSSSPWHTIAFRQNHGEIPPYLVKEALNRRDAALQSNKLTDLEKSILEMQAVQRFPRDGDGKSLLDTLLAAPNLEAQGLNGLVFALIAVNSDPVSGEAPAAWVARLVETQNPEGSFSLVEGRDGEVDITAMALQALAPYADRYQSEVEEALRWLSDQQEENGGFMADEIDNAESTAQVLIALQALNIDPIKDERFIKAGGNLIDHLLGFQLADGSFAHTSGGPTDFMATEQAHLALVALKRQAADEGPLFAFDIRIPMPFVDQEHISPWAREAVSKATGAGLLAGYPDGTFRPNRVLNRAEMVVLLSRVYAWDVQTGSYEGIYKDVPADAWYIDILESAARQGYVAGLAPHTFAPLQELNRQTMAAFLMRDYDFSTTQIYFEFDDQEAISDWAMNDIQYAANAGLMVGVSGNRFAPLEPVTREQGAAILWRLHNQLLESNAVIESGEAA